MKGRGRVIKPANDVACREGVTCAGGTKRGCGSWITGVLDHWGIGSLGSRITGVSDHWGLGSLALG